MPFPTKPKIKMICLCCSKEVEMQPWRVLKFRYCSNVCKWNVKKKQRPHNKMGDEKKTWVRCRNKFCNNGKLQRPFEVRREDYKFCSMQCYQYHRSEQYKLDLEKVEENRQTTFKKNIWFFSK